jgi:hypothetical protein
MDTKRKILMLPTLLGLSGAVFGTVSLYASRAEAIIAGCAHTNPYVIPDSCKPKCHDEPCGTKVDGTAIMCRVCD